MSNSGSDRTRLAKGFCGYAVDLEPEILEFQKNAYPQRAVEEILPMWRWMFVASARRLGIEPLVWMYRSNDHVVAHQGAISVRVKLNERIRTTGWFVETMALEEVRGRAIGPMLIRKALEELPFNLSLGQTTQMRELQFALGWKQVCSLQARIFVTSSSFDLSRKLPTGIAQIAAIALGLRGRLKLAVHKRKGKKKFDRNIIQRFDERHTRIWNDMARNLRCSVVRDAEYLNWKYVDRPNADFQFVQICESGEAVAVAVVTKRQKDEIYRYSRGVIVDVVCPLDRADVVDALLTSCIDYFEKRDTSAVICVVKNRVFEEQLSRYGFLSRGGDHFFLVATDPTEVQDTEVVDAEAWFLTMGDSDLDAYAG